MAPASKASPARRKRLADLVEVEPHARARAAPPRRRFRGAGRRPPPPARGSRGGRCGGTAAQSRRGRRTSRGCPGSRAARAGPRLPPLPQDAVPRREQPALQLEARWPRGRRCPRRRRAGRREGGPGPPAPSSAYSANTIRATARLEVAVVPGVGHEVDPDLAPSRSVRVEPAAPAPRTPPIRSRRLAAPSGRIRVPQVELVARRGHREQVSEVPDERRHPEPPDGDGGVRPAVEAPGPRAAPVRGEKSGSGYGRPRGTTRPEARSWSEERTAQAASGWRGRAAPPR